MPYVHPVAAAKQRKAYMAVSLIAAVSWPRHTSMAYSARWRNSAMREPRYCACMREKE